MSVLNVSIAGFGWWGRHMAKRLSGHSGFRVVSVVETVAERHGDIRALGLVPVHALDEALADPRVDAVILTTPNLLHEEQVVAAAAARKHVFCEKPLGLTGASARRSVEACSAAGVVLGIGHERRFEPAMAELRRLVRKGALGTIMHAEASFSHDKLTGVPAGDWRTSKKVAPAAGMTATGIHLTDLYIDLFGRVETVQAMTSSRVLGWETGDVATVQLGFASGMTATLSAILCTPHFIRMHVFGARRWVEIRNSTHPDTPGGLATMTSSVTGEPLDTRQFDWTDTVVANLEAFRAAVLGEADYPYTSEQLVHNIEVLEAVAQSAERRETIRIPPAG